MTQLNKRLVSMLLVFVMLFSAVGSIIAQAVETDPDGMVLRITPSKISYYKGTGTVTETFSITVTPPDNKIVREFEFELNAPQGTTFQNAELDEDFLTINKYKTKFSKTATKVTLSCGLEQDHSTNVISEATQVMTVALNIPLDEVKSYQIDGEVVDAGCSQNVVYGNNICLSTPVEIVEETEASVLDITPTTEEIVMRGQDIAASYNISITPPEGKSIKSVNFNLAVPKSLIVDSVVLADLGSGFLQNYNEGDGYYWVARAQNQHEGFMQKTTLMTVNVIIPAGTTGDFELAISGLGVREDANTVFSNMINSTAITVTDVDPDVVAVENAITAINAASYGPLAQEDFANAGALKTEVERLAKGTIKTALNITDEQVGEFTVTANGAYSPAAVAGTSADPNGTNGTYTFTISVSKGAGNGTTDEKTLTVTATSYTGVTDEQAVEAAKALFDGESIDLTVDYGKIDDSAAKLKAVEDYAKSELAKDNTTKNVSVSVSSPSGESPNVYTLTLNKGSVYRAALLTVSFTESANPDIALVNTAMENLANAQYPASVSMESYNTSEALTAYVKDIAEDAVGNALVAGMTVSITDVQFTAAVAGDADNAAGSTGSFEFTITVQKGGVSRTTDSTTITITQTVYTGLTNGEAVAAAKTAIETGPHSVDVAFNTDDAGKLAAVQNYVNGLMTGDAAGVTAVVSGLTLSNGDVYTAEVSLSKGQASDTADITITINVSDDPNIQVRDAAISALENANFASVSMEDANSVSDLEAVMESAAEQVLADEGIDGVTVTINSDEASFIQAEAGDADNTDGEDGYYAFTITVSTSTVSGTTTNKAVTILAASYNGLSNTDAVAAAKNALVNGTVQVGYSATQADKTAAVQTYVNNLLADVDDADGVSAIVSYNELTARYDVALSKGLASDSKTLNMTVEVLADPDEAIVETALANVNAASFENIQQINGNTQAALEAYVQGIAVTAVNNDEVTVSVETKSFTAAIRGDEFDEDGTNGTYSFVITLTKGNATRSTTQKSLEILATPASQGGLRGDVDGDGVVDGRDWERLYQHLNGSRPLGAAIDRGDVDGDGVVDGRDWERLYQHLNGSRPLN